MMFRRWVDRGAHPGYRIDLVVLTIKGDVGIVPFLLLVTIISNQS